MQYSELRKNVYLSLLLQSSSPFHLRTRYPADVTRRGVVVTLSIFFSPGPYLSAHFGAAAGGLAAWENGHLSGSSLAPLMGSSLLNRPSL
jgi:hypothetical protein